MNIAFQNHLRELRGGIQFTKKLFQRGSVSYQSTFKHGCSGFGSTSHSLRKAWASLELFISFFSLPLFPSQRRGRPGRETLAPY